MPELAAEGATAGEAAVEKEPTAELPQHSAAEEAAAGPQGVTQPVDAGANGTTADQSEEASAVDGAADAASSLAEDKAESSDDSSSDDEVMSDESDGHKERLAIIRREVLACEEEESGKNAEAAVPRTKNETTVYPSVAVPALSVSNGCFVHQEDQLPELEALDVTLEADTELLSVGKVASIVGQIIVVKGTPDKSALSEESILFTASRQPLGRVSRSQLNSHGQL